MIVFVLIYDLFIFRVRGSHGDSRGRMGMGSGMEDARGRGRVEEWGWRERSGDPGWTSSQGLHSSIHIKLTSVLSFVVSLNITFFTCLRY